MYLSKEEENMLMTSRSRRGQSTDLGDLLDGFEIQPIIR